MEIVALKQWFLFFSLPVSDILETERERMFLQISEYCLPKLVCELHATLPGARSFTDSEKSLMALIGWVIKLPCVQLYQVCSLADGSEFR